MFYVNRSEKVPAKDCRKSEEQQAYSDENITEGTKNSGKCILVSMMPSLPLLKESVVRILKTVRFNTIKVSMKTLIMAASPWQ